MGGTVYEAGTCFMVLDVSEKYLSHIHWTLEYSDPAHSLMNVSVQTVVADLCTVTRQIYQLHATCIP
jgi:hypothetical protein